MPFTLAAGLVLLRCRKSAPQSRKSALTITGPGPKIVARMSREEPFGPQGGRAALSDENRGATSAHLDPLGESCQLSPQSVNAAVSLS